MLLLPFDGQHIWTHLVYLVYSVCLVCLDEPN